MRLFRTCELRSLPHVTALYSEIRPHSEAYPLTFTLICPVSMHSCIAFALIRPVAFGLRPVHVVLPLQVFLIAPRCFFPSFVMFVNSLRPYPSRSCFLGHYYPPLRPPHYPSIYQPAQISLSVTLSFQLVATFIVFPLRLESFPKQSFLSFCRSSLNFVCRILLIISPLKLKRNEKYKI